jgi:glycosyltransferase involved in cell wall biosynthesis
MKILSINLSYIGSTGKIMQGIHRKAEEKGYGCLSMVPGSERHLEAKNVHFLGDQKTRRINAYLGILTGWECCFSVFSTRKALRKIKEFQPDVIHLHNLHNTYINVPMLMRYIKSHNIRVVWTLHDCWAFTGHCPHFSYEKCMKWKTGCNHCPRYRLYPKSVFDNSKLMWKRKKNWFTHIENLTIVTPSQWLSDLVRESYLKEYPIRVINNGIDLNIFKPTESDFRARFDIPNEKKIVLGVAFGWGPRKGLDVFPELAERLGNEYQIVMIGTNDQIDAQLPDNIISIHRTLDQTELAQIYSAADVFVNPTREEVLGLTNIEANACGTPVITFRTGGSPECIDEKSGVVVACDDLDAMEKEIIRICEARPYSQEDCVNRASKFDMSRLFDQYIALFEEK